MKIFENSKFIWISDTGKDVYGEFYGKFLGNCDTLCRISCDGDYTLYINGVYVSSNQYGDFEHYKSYDEIDITPYLCSSENHFAVLVHHYGDDTSRYKAYTPGVIFEVVQNDKAVLVSDEKILARKSNAYVCGLCKRISSQLGYGYTYDSRNEDLWTKGQLFGFENALISDKKCDFVPRPCKRLCLGDTIYGKEILNEGGTHILYDLGAEYVGLLTFELLSGDGKVSIAYGESLTNGAVRKTHWDGSFEIDYYAGKGKRSFTNYMLRFAARYLEITADSPVVFEKIGLIKQYYPVKELPTPLLNPVDTKIYNACVNTLKLSMMEHYVDCPWREQCLYAFDSRNQMLCGYYVFENKNSDYARANLLLMSKDRRDDGLLSICFPCGVDLTIPSFSLHYITSVKEYVENTGDASLFFSVKDKINELFSTFVSMIKDGLVHTFEGVCHWNFYDWSKYSEGTIFVSQPSEPDGILNFLFILALKNYKALCNITNQEFPYESVLEDVMKAAKEKFYSRETGLFIIKEPESTTELVNSLGVLCGLCTADEQEFILEKLATNQLLSSSLSMKCFKFDALLTNEKKYKDTVLSEIRSTYLKMAEETNTVWETVLGAEDFGGNGSLCHGWSAIPVYYYNKLLLGK